MSTSLLHVPRYHTCIVTSLQLSRPFYNMPYLPMLSKVCLAIYLIATTPSQTYAAGGCCCRLRGGAATPILSSLVRCIRASGVTAGGARPLPALALSLEEALLAGLPRREDDDGGGATTARRILDGCCCCWSRVGSCWGTAAAGGGIEDVVVVAREGAAVFCCWYWVGAALCCCWMGVVCGTLREDTPAGANQCDAGGLGSTSIPSSSSSSSSFSSSSSASRLGLLLESSSSNLASLMRSRCRRFPNCCWSWWSCCC